MQAIPPLFDSKGQPHDLLREILKITGVQHDGTLDDIRDVTQATWYQAGKLRSDIDEKYGGKRQMLMHLLQQLGFVHEITVEGKFDIAVIPGAMLTGFRKRLAFLMSLWEKHGVRFSRIVLLGSKRPLNKDKEGAEKLFQRDNTELPIRPDWTEMKAAPTDEAGMMQMVYDQARLPWESQPEYAPIFVATPLKERNQNPNTRDTIEDWLARFVTREDKKKGLLTVVASSQPYVSFQHFVFNEMLPEAWTLRSVGYAAPDSINISQYLDNLAKLIYELAQVE